MIEFTRVPDGRYVRHLSELTPELFDLTAAAANLLESQGISAAPLLDKVLLEDRGATDILSCIICELEELEAAGLFVWDAADRRIFESSMIREHPIL